MKYWKQAPPKEVSAKIPQFFIVRMEKQFENEFKKILDYNFHLSHISDENLIRQYESQLSKCKENIKRIENDYLQEIKVKQPHLPEHEIREMIDDLKNIVSQRFDKVDGNLEKVLLSIGEILASINEQEIEQNSEDKRKAEEILQAIKERLDKMDIPNKREIGENLNGELSAGGKLKLVIKLGILQYEQDLLAYTAKEPIKHWKDLWKVFFKKNEEGNKDKA